MRNVVLTLTVVAVLAAAGLGGTFAGFVDTEVSPDNKYTAGIMDLKVNDKNDPEVPAKVIVTHGMPGKSYDRMIKVENWGYCDGGDLYMHYKDVESVEAGNKTGLVWNGISYVPGSPVGAGVASSEPELGAEEGNFTIGQTWIPDDHTALLGVDYASGVADHLSVVTRVFDANGDGILDNPDNGAGADDPDDGVIGPDERAQAGWSSVASLTGKLSTIECAKNHLGLLLSQGITYIHLEVSLQQISWWPAGGIDYDGDGDIDLDDQQLKWWPTNALQGDEATFDMLFELTGDP